MELAPKQPRPIAIAPAASNGRTVPEEENPLPTMPFTCVTCTRRKVKCDKSGPPCSACRKGRLDCFYEAPPPRKRKRKPAEEVHEKLEQYERVLKQHGLLDEAAKDSPSGDSPLESSLRLSETAAANPWSPHTRGGKLLHGGGKSRWIDSTLWKNLEVEGLGPSSDDEEEGVDGAGGGDSQLAAPDDPFSAAFLGGTVAQRSLLDYHPTYDVAMKLWKTYCSHVEPITKLLHVPTGQAMVQRTAANPSTASKSTECLIFAIYHFAVVAMSDHECQELLNQPRALLQSRYHCAVRQALVNAYFLRTTELPVLQAYTIFLLSVRSRYDLQTFWILTGIAVRIAQRIGLHRDGEALGLKPFDVQMRRRVFWQLIPLDYLSAHLAGSGIALAMDSWDTKQPLNVNDEDLHPDMVDPPIERARATDMIFCLARTEVGKFHQKIRPFIGDPLTGRPNKNCDSSMMKNVEAAIDELERTIESKFLRYCDFFEPIHCMTMGLGRGAPLSARLRLKLPRLQAHPDMYEDERRETINMVMRLFDHDIAIHSNPMLLRFAWHLQAFFQWDPMIWVLNELRRGSPAIQDPSLVWSKIEQIFSCHPQFISQKRALHGAICKATLRAWDGSAHPRDTREPEFISRIRSSLSKRSESSQGKTSPSAANLNPWTPADTLDEVPSVTNNEVAGYNTLLPGNYLDGVNFDADAVDWLFWDQVLRDTGNLNASGALPQHNGMM